jgi:hypothetical protein
MLMPAPAMVVMYQGLTHQTEVLIPLLTGKELFELATPGPTIPIPDHLTLTVEARVPDH